MANAHRGEVELKAGDKTYTLALTINALCDVEEASPGVNILGDFSRLSNIRLMLWAALRTHHPELQKSDAGRILQEAGFDAAKIAVTKAIERGMPPKDKTENPQ